MERIFSSPSLLLIKGTAPRFLSGHVLIYMNRIFELFRDFPSTVHIHPFSTGLAKKRISPMFVYEHVRLLTMSMLILGIRQGWA
jgi:hypothetical protein